jgi:hypothetical protein
MARTARKAKRPRKAADKATLAQTLAPEDIRRGDYVAVLHEVYEYPTWFWCDGAFAQTRDEAVRVRFTPHDDAAPMKVQAVSLPFVLVKQPCGRRRTIDVRRRPLARLAGSYGAAAWRVYRKAGKAAGGGASC